VTRRFGRHGVSKAGGRLGLDKRERKIDVMFHVEHCVITEMYVQ